MTKRTKSAGGIIVNPQGKVVLVLPVGRKKGWFFPKGMPEPGETLLRAAIREIREEAGIIDLKLARRLGSYQRHPVGENGRDDESEIKTITMFLFSSDQKRPATKDRSEIGAVRWIDKEKILGRLFHPKDREFFLKVKNEI
jgi:8-oxo-dGTP pyrophosphatase MutT (NUDIX family)